jgi:hypothetical protein
LVDQQFGRYDAPRGLHQAEDVYLQQSSLPSLAHTVLASHWLTFLLWRLLLLLLLLLLPGICHVAR